MARDKKKDAAQAGAARADRGGEAGQHAGPPPRQPGEPRRGGPAAVPRRPRRRRRRRRSRTGSGRLELAEAIASPDNPLTARVIVNRVWMHHFGRGLVGTPSQLRHARRAADAPRAARLPGRAVRRRRLVGQEAAPRDHAVGDVPAEQPARRARTRRSTRTTAALADEPPAAGGRAVARRDARRRRQPRPHARRAVGRPVAPDNRRRTLYGAVSRHNLDPLLRLFDFPDPNLTSDRRPVTTVPLQQLFVLNSEFMARQAKAFAAPRDGDARADDAARIRTGLPARLRPAADRPRGAARRRTSCAGAARRRTALGEVRPGAAERNEFVFVD